MLSPRYHFYNAHVQYMSTSDIPVTVQVYRAYPHVRELLELRGYDVSNYPPLGYEEIQDAKAGGPEVKLSPVPPIVVAEKTAHCFGKSSREHQELMRKVVSKGVYEFTIEFHKQYPTLAELLTEAMHTTDTKALQSASRMIDTLIPIYQEFAQKRAEVHFHQCFNPENLWGANSRDKRFMNEMNAMITSVEATAQERFKEHTSTLAEVLTPEQMLQYGEALESELTRICKRRRTYIFLYRTRSKASSTLDQKYEHYCAQLMKKHGLFVQLFNLRHLMFNVTKHEIQPKQEPLDVWHDGDEIAKIKRTYNINNLAKAFPVIAVSDPVAKFIGLQRGQLSKITRINPSAGTSVNYRWCK